MGCDGGTIPTRDELVRLKKKPEQKDKDTERIAQWKHCAITQELLRPPIAACELGKLYNKESVLELLLDRSKFECAASFEHLRGLKDVKVLRLTENPAHATDNKSDAYLDRNTADYICPVTGLEMSGKYKFVYHYVCGCVLSDRALKEVKSDNCLKCGKPYLEADVIVLNGSEEDVETLRGRMEERRRQAKLDKKQKKKHKIDASSTSSSSSTTSAAAAAAAAAAAGSSQDAEEGPSTSKQAKLDPTSTTAGKPKLTGSGAASSKLANGKGDVRSKSHASIQKDPKTSSTYKGLFTTCDAAKKQPRAHWVTYNPCYN